jgi:hypothetical protein
MEFGPIDSVRQRLDQQIEHSLQKDIVIDPEQITHRCISHLESIANFTKSQKKQKSSLLSNDRYYIGMEQDGTMLEAVWNNKKVQSRDKQTTYEPGLHIIYSRNGASTSQCLIELKNIGYFLYSLEDGSNVATFADDIPNVAARDILEDLDQSLLEPMVEQLEQQINNLSDC